eukprot:CAMPEP_0176406890 /NCGR_PEP_ID=MMETSP0127-20121128/1118_1 /TAXON_ID=938130 /ORGANISM="Platyophrya macrostoma, Strain WH" /LENGTH=255 /DNA_ID=CAMNT_0017786057 /DNA_START=163 /DNA_END=930 /DNA_ORIENTATION=+
MEYVYEKNHVMDPKKRSKDIETEQSIAFAYDRLDVVAQKNFERRMGRLIERMNDALEAIPSEVLRDEALMINSQQPPLNFRRPSLTPPVFGYESGFGFDVPQLRAQVPEYPPVARPTDKLQYRGGDDVGDSGTGASSFPFVNPESIHELTQHAQAKLEAEHGDIREAAPVTGVEGEAWEAYVALNKVALARQQLILDLAADAELKEKYDGDEGFRQQELQRRGILPLDVEIVDPQRLSVDRHYAQEPHYQPIRKV